MIDCLLVCDLIFCRYKLKTDFLLEVNPHFYHFSSPGHQSNAIDENLKQRKLAKQTTGNYFNKFPN